MKPDTGKSKIELIEELNDLRSRLAEFESFQNEYERSKFLAKNKEYQQLIAELSHDMFSLHNAEGDYIYASPGSYDLIGYHPNELIGKNAYEFFHSEDFKRIAEHHERTTTGVVSPPVTYRIKHKNGDFIWVETTNRFVFKPGSEEIEMIICVTRNVTRQKESYRKWEESEMRFRNIIENTPIGMSITDEKGFYQYVNDAYCRIYGFTDEELLGRHFTIVVPKKDRSKMTKMHDRFIKGEEEVEGVWNVIDKDKKELTIISNAVRIMGTDGKPKKVTFVNDVTDRELYKKNLKEHEERFRQIAENINEAFWLVRNKKIEYMSPAFKKITGYDVDFIKDNFSNFAQIVHPEDKEKYFYSGYEKDLFKGRAVTYRIIKQNGEIRWLRTVSSPMNIGKRSENNLVGVTQDITDEYVAREELLKSEKKYQLLFNNSNDSIMVHKMDENNFPTNFIEVNETACRSYGYTKEEFRKLSPKDLDVGMEPEDYERIVNELLREHQVVFQGLHKVKTGRHIPVEISSQIFMLDNEPTVISIVRDISNQRKAEEQLLKAKNAADRLNQLKSVILANMSHELRTPLNAIINYADILLRKTEDDESKMILSGIKESGEGLHKTLTTMLDLSKVESDTTRLNFSKKNISNLILSVISLYKQKADNKSLKIISEIDDDSLEINTDEVLFNEMFRQLMDNAIKFTSEGYVKIKCSEVKIGDSYFARIDINDTGPGIGKEFQKTIFDAFRQESEGSTRIYEGTGLGLTIVKKIIELLKGKIHLESDIGKGSKFTLYLPL